MALNPRQRLFVTHYLSGCSGAEAVRRAGYACKTPQAAAATADRLLRNVEIKAAIAAAAEKAELSAEWATRRLMREATREGEGASHSARVRALELLGRRFGLFAEQLEVSGPAGGPIDLRVLTDAQLAQLDAILAAADAGGGAGGAGPPGAGRVRPPGLAGAQPGA